MPAKDSGSGSPDVGIVVVVILAMLGAFVFAGLVPAALSQYPTIVAGLAGLVVLPRISRGRRGAWRGGGRVKSGALSARERR